MILTCPSCSTRYFADAEAFGPSGRQVRCAACGHVWRATEDELEEVVPEVADFEDDMGEAIDELETEFVPPPPAAAARSVEKKNAPHGHLIAWGGLAGAVLAFIACAYIFRISIVEVWPRTASVYALAGVEAKAGGLDFGEVSADRRFEQGAPVLTLTSAIRNLTGQDQIVPTVRVVLRDGSGKQLAGWAVVLDAAAAPAKGALAFTADLPDAPLTGSDLELRFIDAAVAGDVQVQGRVLAAAGVDELAALHDDGDHGEHHGGDHVSDTHEDHH